MAAVKFQSTRPHRARLAEDDLLRVVPAVSIHAPTQGATSQLHVRTLCSLFQSTRPHRARRYRRPRSPSSSCFNPRAHTGRDGRTFIGPLANTVFQSTRPHRARHDVLLKERLARDVSIHAPTQGATRGRRGLTGWAGCFNPRAHTGRDCKHKHKLLDGWCFNPRAHTGRDAFHGLSLHRFGCFNPRAHTGRDTRHDERHDNL